ncbi:hypothetical protein EI546_08585 [Aequorivita sp. H23M31]|uniref:Peptidylprolyl isomerase n=1 Tax=Aequorivita ciconiae TaxID=2494375 RepID=A0A410G3E6_9FLAO|nr:hypothetical protein [Aequorivita sp. H23M31]QAA81773.1 hypothetical protein EI546_08585 [Aequorivita sp. H23M31]
MKNLLTVLAFAGTLFIGMQSVSAQSLSQDQNRPEVIAKQETAKISDELGLNGDQQRATFRALVAKEVSYQKDVNGKDLNSPAVKAEKQKTDAALNEAMKKILTDDQYAKWLKTNN